MNEFSVKTPTEWKEKLYKKTTETKTVRIRSAILLAAVIAFLICVSGSAFAVRVSRAPEYFGSKYLGLSESSDQVYSEKNLVFQSDREDLELTCKGIVGDDYNINLIFQLKSTGDITFKEGKRYWIEEIYDYIPLSNGRSRGTNVITLDERTLQIELGYGSIDGVAIAGRNIKLNFENIIEYKENSFIQTDFFDCNFEGKIIVDYKSTNRKLQKTENTVEMHGVTLKPDKAEISNLNLSYTLEVVDGEEIFGAIDELDIIKGTLTLNYKDGTEETFNVTMPPQNENDIIISSVGKRGNKLRVTPHFRSTVNASEIASVELDGVEVFVSK